MQNRKFGRTAEHRKALLRNLATEVILRGKIETTESKAKDLRKTVDGLITIAKKDTLAARRQAAAFLMPVKNKAGKTAVQVLFEEVAPKYKERNGGYTKVTKTDIRRGDCAPMAIIELV